MVKVRTREQLDQEIEQFSAASEPDNRDFGGEDMGESTSKMRQLRPDQCEPWRFHNRSQLWLTGEKHEQLKASIREFGQQQPGLVRAPSDAHDTFQIIFGLRRWYACKDLVLPFDANVLPHDAPDKLCAQLMATENDDSENISEYEKALSYRQLIQANIFENQIALAAAHRVSKQYVSKLMRASALAEVEWLTPILNTMITSVSINKAAKLVTLISDKDNDKKLKKSVENGLLAGCLDANDVFIKLVACIEGDNKKEETVLLQKSFKSVASSKTATSGTTTIKIDPSAFNDDTYEQLVKTINVHLESLRKQRQSTMVD